jgi:ATP-dependent helicase/nuclease subunit A
MVQAEKNKINFTASQSAAIGGASRRTVVSAGAGTGKTAVLVERFVSLVISGAAGVDQILAITFTEKAAQEMKSRIGERLAEEGRMEEYRQVENAWISTVHSFCSRLLKENPFSAKIDPEFGIIDETEKAIAEEELFDQLFDETDDGFLALLQFYNEKEVKKALLSYIGLQRSLGRDISHIDRVLAAPQKLLEKVEAGLKSRKDALSRIILNNLDEVKEVYTAGALEKKRLEALEYAVDVRSAEINADTLQDFRSILKGMRSTPLKGCDPGDYVFVYDRLRAILDAVKSENVLMHYDADDEKQLLEQRTLFLKAAKRYWELFDLHKSSMSVLDYEDLQLKAKAVLTFDKPVLDEFLARFKQVMVDEFQDINPLQKEIIEIISQRANLFMVGDVKQSIYGFRNADVDLMLDEQRRALESGESSSISLRENFRSSEGLINFFNDFFSKLWLDDDFPFEPLVYNRGDSGLAIPDRPSVEFHLVPTIKHSRKSGDEVSAAKNIDTARQYESVAAAGRIKELVEKEQLEVFDKGLGTMRPVCYGDVAVLCRSGGIFRLYADAFDDIGVPYYFLKSRTYFERHEVTDVINFLDVLDNPLQDVKLTAVLCSPLFCVQDDTLVHLGLSVGERRNDDPWLFFALSSINKASGISDDEQEKLSSFRNIFQKLSTIKNRVPPADLIERAVEMTNYEMRLFCDRLGPKRSANLRKLIDIAQKFSSRGHSGIGAFLRYYQAIKENAIEEAEAPTETVESDSVKVMTVHAAKGLEFPVVFIADIGREFNIKKPSFLPHKELEIAFNLKSNLIENNQYHDERKGKRSASYLMAVDEINKRELAEEKRLLYVASTRARDLLIFTGAISAGGNSSNTVARSGSKWVLDYLGEHIELGEGPVENVIEFEGFNARLNIFHEVEIPEKRRSKKKVIDQYRKEIAAGHSISGPESSDFTPTLESIKKQIIFDSEFEEKYFPARLSVTDILMYTQCPMRFYAEKVLGYSEELFYEEESSSDTSGLHGAELGSIIHESLSRINFAGEIDQQLDEIAASLPYSQNETDQVVELMKTFLSSEYIGKLKNAKKYRQEYPLELLVDETLIAATLDLMWDDSDHGHFLLDFKTDQNIPENGQHELQMRLYCLMINDILGYTPTEAILYYLRHNKTVVLPVTAKEIDDTRQELGGTVQRICENRFEPVVQRRCASCGYSGKLCPITDILAQR